MKRKIVALGEVLIDFVNEGKGAQGNPLMEANPGGAPANFLAMCARLGESAAFVGKVGDDIFGRQLIAAVEACGIESRYIAIDNDVNTTLAFVSNNEAGDREFSFYRNPGADTRLTREDIPVELISQAAVFHYGTLSFTHECCREATLYALELAGANNVLRSFDPNLRKPLWKDMDLARAAIFKGLEYCDILKISDYEVEFITGCRDMAEGMEYIKTRYPSIRFISLTRGENGSTVYYKDMIVHRPALMNSNTVDTTGAGDCYGACQLCQLVDTATKTIRDLSREQIEDMMDFSAAAASVLTTRRGAMSQMPALEDIHISKKI